MSKYFAAKDTDGLYKLYYKNDFLSNFKKQRGFNTVATLMFSIAILGFILSVSPEKLLSTGKATGYMLTFVVCTATVMLLWSLSRKIKLSLDETRKDANGNLMDVECFDDQTWSNLLEQCGNDSKDNNSDIKVISKKDVNMLWELDDPTYMDKTIADNLDVNIFAKSYDDLKAVFYKNNRAVWNAFVALDKSFSYSSPRNKENFIELVKTFNDGYADYKKVVQGSSKKDPAYQEVTDKFNKLQLVIGNAVLALYDNHTGK